MQDKSDTQRRRSGFRTLLGYRTREWREGYGEVELTVEPRHLNAVGITHGGVYMALLDVAMGHAVAFATIPGNVRYSTTVSLTTNFLKGARSGDVLTAMGRIDGVEGRLATATGEVRDAAGTLCAAGQATFLFFPGSERPEGVPRNGSPPTAKS